METTQKKKYEYEYRSASDVKVDESEKGKMVITGRAIVFGKPAPVPSRVYGTTREIISPHALDNTDMHDVLLKLQHEQRGATLARTRNGSLKLEKRDDGLYFRAELPNTQSAKDTYECIRTGLTTDISFGFRSNYGTDKIDRATNTRFINDIKYLRELSVVDNGAYGESCYAEARAAELEELEAAAAERAKKIKLLKLRTHFLCQ